MIRYDSRALCSSLCSLLPGERPSYRRCRSQIYADEGGGLCPPRVIVHDYLYIITNKDTIHGRCAHRSARCFQVLGASARAEEHGASIPCLPGGLRAFQGFASLLGLCCLQQRTRMQVHSEGLKDRVGHQARGAKGLPSRSTGAWRCSQSRAYWFKNPPKNNGRESATAKPPFSHYFFNWAAGMLKWCCRSGVCACIMRAWVVCLHAADKTKNNWGAVSSDEPRPCWPVPGREFRGALAGPVAPLRPETTRPVRPTI